jgi:hypothetical protein
MAQFFDRYLNFYDKQKTPFKGRAFLYPVWCWELLVPKVNHSPLNIFQRTILSLIRARKTDTEEIAHWMGIESEMVLYIIAGQLQPNGWLTERGELTDKGRDILEGDMNARRELITGYVFQDGINGNLWPRVVNSLPDVEPDSFNNRGFPDFVTNRERGWKISPFILQSSALAPALPSPHILKNIIQEGNNAIHNQRVRDDLSDDQLQELEFDEIEQISDQPFKSYVFCWAIPDDDMGWSIADPVAITKTASWLRESILDQLDKNPALAKNLRTLVGEVRENETWKEMNQRVIADVDLQMFAEFPGAQKIPHLASCLGVLLRREQELATSPDDARFENCNDLVTQAQRVFEACFRWMLKTWPVAHKKIISGNWSMDELTEAITSIGSGFLSQDAIRNLSNQKGGSIWYAANKDAGKASIRPLVAATFFTLANHTDHPLLSFQSKELAMDKILSLATERNSVSHASSIEIELDYALESAAFTAKWIKKLLKDI